MRRIESVKKAYHSTRQKGLKKFESRTTMATIDTGEGAHVHGWGLYLQADEIANRKDYLDMFTGYPSDIGEDYKVHAWDSDFMAYHTEDAGQIDEWNFYNVFTFDGSNLLPESKLVITLKLNGYTNREINYFLTELLEKAEKDEDYYSDVLIHYSKDEIRKAAQKANYLHDYEAEPLGYKDPDPLPDGTHFEGASQYTVEIPDDMIFIDEDTNIPEWLSQVFVDTFEYVLANDEYGQKKPFRCSDIARGIDEEVHNKYLTKELIDEVKERKKNLIKELNEKRNTQIKYYSLNYNGREFYELLKEHLEYSDEKASLWLSENGIDGMTYEGGRDGGCFVIYNCDKLKIIGEY